MTDQARARQLLVRRKHPPTTFGSIWAQAKFRVPVAILTFAIIWLCVSVHLEIYGALLLGIWGGSLLRDIRFASAVAQVWPFTERVFDWEKIKSIAEGK